MTPFARNTLLSAAIHLAIVLALLVCSATSCRRRKSREVNMFVSLVPAQPLTGQQAAPRPQKTIPEPPQPIPKAPKPKPKPEPPKPKPEPPKPKPMTESQISRMLRSALDPKQIQAAAVEPDAPDWYLALIRSILYDAWRQPGMLSRSAGLVTVMSLKVRRDGTVIERRMVKSSGEPMMDRSVEEAVASVARLEPLPQTMPGAWQEIQIDFELTPQPR